jgi:hypothetical protein
MLFVFIVWKSLPSYDYRVTREARSEVLDGLGLLCVEMRGPRFKSYHIRLSLTSLLVVLTSWSRGKKRKEFLVHTLDCKDTTLVISVLNIELASSFRSSCSLTICFRTLNDSARLVPFDCLPIFFSALASITRQSNQPILLI